MGRRNYLRVRGEYDLPVLLLTFLPELPPRARRILHSLWGDQDIVGTTSACAENTRRIFRRCLAPRNYLRVRGEYPK